MSAPVRVQQRRTRGWRKPENTVSVARPSIWGNHWIVVRDKSGERWQANLAGVFDPNAAYAATREAAARLAVHQYRRMLLAVPPDEQDWATIRGKNLMCFCPLDQPCHADVLLELANQDSAIAPDVAVPDHTDIAEHMDVCTGCDDHEPIAWCEWCQADTIPIRGCCHECNQPISRTRPADRLEDN